jgi:hypothetical protein
MEAQPMCDLQALADELRSIEATARDARAVAQGLRDTAEACSPDQAALKKRLEIASISLLLVRTAADHAAATLRGLRSMAEIEARNGSSTWRKALSLIDSSLRELA